MVETVRPARVGGSHRPRRLRGRLCRRGDGTGSLRSMASPERTASPRTYLMDPSAFGTAEAVWRTDVDLNDEQVAVDVMLSWLQHLASYRLRDEAASRGMTVGDLADQVGWDAETLRRRLRGEQRMTLEDLLSWVRRYGVDVVPPLENPEDWFPPSMPPPPVPS